MSKAIFPLPLQSFPSLVTLISYCNRYLIFLKLQLLFEHEWWFYLLFFLFLSCFLKSTEKMEVHSSFTYCLFDYRKELKVGVTLLLCFNGLYQVQSSCCSLLFPIIACLLTCPPVASLRCLEFKPCNLL